MSISHGVYGLKKLSSVTLGCKGKKKIQGVVIVTKIKHGQNGQLLQYNVSCKFPIVILLLVCLFDEKKKKKVIGKS